MSKGARSICLQALNAWESSQEFADDVLHRAFRESELSVLDRSFVTEAFYGTIRQLRRLDFVIGLLRDKGIDPEARQAVRLGLYQILHMRVAEHAAVNETVELAGPARGLVNALLRRTLRERASIERAIQQAPRGVGTSHPDFLVERWEKQFGPDATGKLLDWNNTPPGLHVRVNTLKTTVEALLEQGTSARRNAFHPMMLDVDQVPVDWIAQGLCYVQDPSTLAACDLLNPQPGETVLDACAAPGGKTTYMAALMQNSGRIAACDSDPVRVERLTENLMRMEVANTQPIQIHWLRGETPFQREMFDRILLDAPCSNTGVLRRRVDARWRLTPEDFTKMPGRQAHLLEVILPMLKPGGSLVYSTCSLEQEENLDLVEQCVANHPELELQKTVALRPFESGVDGAFAALLTKRATDGV